MFVFQNIDEKVFMTAVNSGIRAILRSCEGNINDIGDKIILSVFSWFVH